MSLIPFPNVPSVDGVPPIPRSPNFPPVAQAALGIIQGALWRSFQVQTEWGVYDKEGNPLADPSAFQNLPGVLLGTIGGTTLSTSSVQYGKEAKVSDFPLERGGFAAYNKVEMPASPVVVLAMAGSESDRTKFLNAIDIAVKSTDLYSVVTPEVTYANYNLVRYSYERRADRGATLLIVELVLSEIRQVSVQFTNVQINDPKNVGATPQVDSGIAQPQQPRKSTLTSTNDKLLSIPQ